MCPTHQMENADLLLQAEPGAVWEQHALPLLHSSPCVWDKAKHLVFIQCLEKAESSLRSFQRLIYLTWLGRRVLDINVHVYVRRVITAWEKSWLRLAPLFLEGASLWNCIYQSVSTWVLARKGKCSWTVFSCFSLLLQTKDISLGKSYKKARRAKKKK